jgi:hypothetical protein
MLRWALGHPRLASAIFIVPILAVAVWGFVVPVVRGVVRQSAWQAVLDDPDFRPREDVEGSEWGELHLAEFLASRLGVSRRTIQGTGTPVLVFEVGDEVIVSRLEDAGAAERAARRWSAAPAEEEPGVVRRHEVWGCFVLSAKRPSAGLDRILGLLRPGEAAGG